MLSFRQGLTGLSLLMVLAYSPVASAQLGGLLGGLLGGGGGAATAAPAVGTGPMHVSCEGSQASGCGSQEKLGTLDFCFDGDKDQICDDRDECPTTPANTPVFLNGCHLGKSYVLRGVNFEFDSGKRITAGSRPELDKAIAVLQAQPEILVSIDGHTDSKGDDAYNLNLSHRRARTVYNYFIEAGVGAERLVYRGFGEAAPIAPNQTDDGGDSPDGRAQNRRVELSVLESSEFAYIAEQNRNAPVYEEPSYSAPVAEDDFEDASDDIMEEAADDVTEEAEVAEADATEEEIIDDSAFEVESAEAEVDELLADEDLLAEEVAVEEAATEETATQEAVAEDAIEEEAVEESSEETVIEETELASEEPVEETAPEASSDESAVEEMAEESASEESVAEEVASEEASEPAAEEVAEDDAYAEFEKEYAADDSASSNADAPESEVESTEPAAASNEEVAEVEEELSDDDLFGDDENLF